LRSVGAIFPVKYCIAALLFAFNLYGGESLFRLPVTSSIEDISIVKDYENALDSVFSTLQGKNYSIIVPSDPDSFPADSNVCAARIDTTEKGDLVFTIDFFFRGIAADSAWSLTFTLCPEESKKEFIIPLIIKALQSNRFPGLFLSRIQIIGANGAEVLIDSAVSERKVPYESFLPSGQYLIEIRKNQFINDQFVLDLEAGKDTTLHIDFWKKTALLRCGLFSGSALCLAGAMYLHYYQSTTYDIYLREKRDTGRMNDLYTRYQAAVIGRNCLLTAGSTGLILGLGVSFSIPF
jgi:hypothetical protein